MNSNTIIIILLVILIILYVVDMKHRETFRNAFKNEYNNSEYGLVNYNTRYEDGIKTVIPHVVNACKTREKLYNDDDVRDKYLAKNVVLNQTIPNPNNLEDNNNILYSNKNSINQKNNDLYDDLIDIKSLNSMITHDEYNSLYDIEDELATIN